MVTLNRAVAVAMAEGPPAGLVVLDPVGERLAGHYRLHAVRAHLLEMAGDTEGARAVPRRRRPHDEPPEQRYLTAQAARLTRARR